MDRIVVISEGPEKIAEALLQDYRVHVAHSQDEAIEKLAHHLPNLIIMEEKQPQIDVFKMIEYVKRSDELSQVPIIVLSDTENEDFEKRCLRRGVCDFIFYPFSKVGIRSRVARVLEMENTKKTLQAAISMKIAEVDEIRDMAKRDPLTKLCNRSYFEDRINSFLSERRNCGALLMIDMDDFKSINDTYGHIVGDEFLIEFANTLKALIRNDDIAGRLGGDEFIVFLKDLTAHSVLIEKVEQLIVTLEKRIVKPDGSGGITVSTGIAVSPGDGRSFNQLYQCADRALYHVKQNSKGSYHFYSEEGTGSVGRVQKKNTQVDLDHLRAFIQEVGYNRGAYHVEYDGFKKIYRFIARCIGRTRQEVQTVLFTIQNDAGRLPDLQELVFAMDHLKEAVHDSIRRGDVATNYSSSQYVVILMDSSYEDASYVADRIRDKYMELQNDTVDAQLNYDIQTVTCAPVSDDF